MPYGKGSEAELRQRQAPRSHGVYAIRSHGEKVMTPEQRSARQELSTEIQTKQGAVDTLRDLAVDAIMLSKVAQSYVIEQHEEGKNLDQIPLARALPAFQNSASRILGQYLQYMPDESSIIDVTEMLRGKDSEED